jgi:serine/threonine-protein kinase RsbT
MVRNEARVEITSTMDIVSARQEGRALAQELGFAGSEVTLIAAAISEVARNIVDYARRGEIVLAGVQNGRKHGIKIVARDEGPGIADIAQAMQYGFSTQKRPGVGLPGAKWLMDEFDIESVVGKGTVVTMKKWTANLGYQNQ